MPIDKINGVSVGAVVTFAHIGRGGLYDIGIGIKYTPAPLWLVSPSIPINDDDSYLFYSNTVPGGIWNTDLGNDRRVDVLKFIQVAGGPRDIGGNGFVLADWDREVFVNKTSLPITIQEQLASISPYLIIAWAQRQTGGIWNSLMYDPADPQNSTLLFYQNGDTASIQVTQACVLSAPGKPARSLVAGWNYQFIW